MSVTLETRMSVQSSSSIISNNFTQKAAQFDMLIITNHTIIFGIDYIKYQDSICFTC